MAGPEQLKELMQKLRANREAAQVRRKNQEAKARKEQGDDSRTTQAGKVKMEEVRQKNEDRVTNLRNELADKLKNESKPASKALKGVNLNTITDEATLKALSDFAEIDPPELQENPAAVHDLTDTLQRQINLAKQSGKSSQEIEAQAQVAAEISARTTVLVAENPEALSKQVDAVVSLVKDSGSRQEQTVKNVATELGALAQKSPEVENATQVVLEQVVQKVEPPKNPVEPFYKAAKEGVIVGDLSADVPVKPLQDNQAYHGQSGKAEKATATIETPDVVVVAEAKPEAKPDKPTALEELDTALNTMVENHTVTEEQQTIYKEALQKNDREALHTVTGEIYEKLPESPQAQDAFTDLMAATVKSRLPEEAQNKVDALVESIKPDVSTKDRADSVKNLNREQTNADGALADGVVDTAVFYLTAQVVKAELTQAEVGTQPDIPVSPAEIVVDAINTLIDEVIAPPSAGGEVSPEAVVESMNAVNDSQHKTGPESNTLLSRFVSTFEKALPEDATKAMKKNQNYIEAVAPIKGEAPLEPFATTGTSTKIQEKVDELNTVLERTPERFTDEKYIQAEIDKLARDKKLSNADAKELIAQLRTRLAAARLVGGESTFDQVKFEKDAQAKILQKADAATQLQNILGRENTTTHMLEVQDATLRTLAARAMTSRAATEAQLILLQLDALQPTLTGADATHFPAIYAQVQRIRDNAVTYEGKPTLRQVDRAGLSDAEFQEYSAYFQIDNLRRRLDALEGGDPERFVDLIREVLFIENKLFGRADFKPNSQFQDSFNQLYHEPMYQELLQIIQEAKNQIIERNVHVTVKVKTKLESGDIGLIDMDLADALEALTKFAVSERLRREYGHNVRFFISIRGKPEILANYSEQFHTEDLEFAFVNNEDIGTSARVAEAVLLKLLSDNDWENISDMSNMHENIVKNILAEIFNVMDNPENDDGIKDVVTKNHWRVGRGFSTGWGAVLLGGSAKGIDHMAGADPPGGAATTTGYWGDSLFAMWNFARHHVYRWVSGNVGPDEHGHKNRAKHPFGKWFYAQMADVGAGTRKPHDVLKDLLGHLRPYEVESLAKAMETHATKNKRVYVRQGTIEGGDVGIPITQIVDLLKVYSLFKRGGWRMQPALMHHIVRTDGRRFNLRIDKSIDWNDVDVASTWENMRRVGAPAVEWFLGALDGKKSLLNPNQIDDIRDHNVDRNGLMQHLRDRNPLRFVWHDELSRGDAGSVYQLALGNMNQTLRDHLQDPKQRDAVEYDMMTISDYLVQKNRLELGELTPVEINEIKEIFNKDGQGEARYTAAVEYWEAIQVALSAEKMEFFTHQRLAYGIESVDLNYQKVRFADTGPDTIARMFKDANTLVENVVKPAIALPRLASEVSEKRDFEPYLKYLKAVYDAEMDVHGAPDAEEVVYKLAFLMIRYHDKSWWNRLPFGIGKASTIAMAFGGRKASVAQELQGYGAWAWDEQMKAGFVRAIEEANLLRGEYELQGTAYVNPFNATRLRSEVGARLVTGVSYDVTRSAVPTILFLVALSALSQQEEEERKRAA